MLFAGKPEFRITQQEMIKGIDGHGYYDELVIPIIENTAWEHELADSLGQAIARYPKACAVLVRQHGMYVWGKTWEQAKRHGECLHYLFDAAIQIEKLGLTHMITKKLTAVDCLHKRLSYRHLVLDIEGTLSPITFVKDVLFPYSLENLENYLTLHWNSPELESVISDLRVIASQDSRELADKEAVIQYLREAIHADRKITPLKQLQGKIWQSAYESGKLVSEVYPDVPINLRRLCDTGVKVSIYSSGSRHAQHLLFRYSNHGDLRSLLNCYFDTKVGQKTEKSSYAEIITTLGAEPSDVLFVTDVLGEAQAAKAAGLNAAIAVRPGNKPISESHEFPLVSSFDEL
jgi:methylthioribulose 1-phosphate dehydratase/enolase-phosphatase E1